MRTTEQKRRWATYMKSYRLRDPDGWRAKARARRNSRSEHYNSYQTARRYGLSLEEASILRATPSCKICGVSFNGNGKRKRCVDHDHATGVVRGVICSRCNSTIGYVEEDVKVLESVIKYLQRTL
jgi:hypothetical protein